MALADDLRTFSLRSLAELDAGHDYFTHTKRAWWLLVESVREGRRYTFRNRNTGTVLSQQTTPGLAQHYISNYLRSSSFQHFVTLFEDFFFDLLRLWLTAYPESLSSKTLTFGEVLKAGDTSAITLAVVDKELNEIKYKRVADWFAYLDKLVKLNCPTADEIEQIAEIKASRDVLVHNRGTANATYVAKAGRRARFNAGETLDISERYHGESWKTIRKVIRELSEAASTKV
jgi:hypothetical protein